MAPAGIQRENAKHSTSYYVTPIGAIATILGEQGARNTLGPQCGRAVLGVITSSYNILTLPSLASYG